MVDCIDCNPNVFDVTGSDSVVTSSGYSLQTELDNLKGLVDDLGNQDDDLQDGSLGTLTLTDSPQVVVLNSPFRLEVKPGLSNTSIMYDLRGAMLNTKQYITNVEAYGTKSGVNGRIFRGSSHVGSFNASPDNFPILLKIDVTELNPEGQKILNFSKTVLNAESTTEEFFTQTDLTAKSVTSQKDVNEMFDTQIGSLQNQLSQVESINVNGVVGLNNVLVNQQNEIDGIKNGGGDDVLQSEVDALKTTVEAQAETINDQTSVIEQLKFDISVLKSAVGL